MTEKIRRGQLSSKTEEWIGWRPGRLLFRAFAPSHLLNLRWCWKVLEPATFFVRCARMWWFIIVRRGWFRRLWGGDLIVSWWHLEWSVRIHISSHLISSHHKQLKTNSTYPSLDDRKNTSWAIVKQNRGVNWMTSWSSAFSRLCAVALTKFTLVLEGPRACYFFCTLRTDVMIHNRAAEVISTAVRGGDLIVSWWHLGWRVRIHHVTKIAQRSRRRQTEQGKILPLLLHALIMPPCSDRPRKCSLSGGETA